MADCDRRPIDLSGVPGWFEAKSGFRFLDWAGDEVIVIGEGGWRNAAPVSSEWLQPGLYTIEMKPWTLLGAFRYKGEWHLIDLLDVGRMYWKGARPIERLDQKTNG